MKALNHAKASAVLTAFFFFSETKAQFNSEIPPVPNNRINVELSIRPSVPGFHAGISLQDSTNNKVKVWISNSEETRFTITIGSHNTTLWQASMKDAYYTQVFDLSPLDDGEYFVRISSKNEITERKLFISTTNYVKREMIIE